MMRESVPAEERFTKKVEVLKEGGIHTWFVGEVYPEKHFVYPEMFAILNPFKKTLPAILQIIKESSLAKLLLIAVLILPGGSKLRELLWKAYTSVFWSGLRFVAFQPIHLCTAARELRRALLEVFRAEPSSLHEQLIDAFILFFEYDNAYRYRGQDVAGILNDEAFIADPVREAKRVFGEYLKRELEIKEKGRLFQWIPYLLHLPKYRRLVCNIVAEVDWDKVKLDTADRYWCYHRTDYNADGLDLETRMRRRALMRMS